MNKKIFFRRISVAVMFFALFFSSVPMMRGTAVHLQSNGRKK